MTPVEILFEKKQFSLPNDEKRYIISKSLEDLLKYHYGQCNEYKNIIKNIYNNQTSDHNSLFDYPFVPVRIFKNQTLKSVPDSEIIKTLTSSGTTDQTVSKVYLDRETSILQTKALASIVTSFIGSKRLPMIIIDSDSSLGNKSGMSARGAGLVGLSNFGRDHFFALDYKMELKTQELLYYIEKHKGEPLLIFGFTFMVWQNFYKELISQNIKLDLSGSILIHSGGWKKLNEMAVSNNDFKTSLINYFGNIRIHNFYGMVEQVGSVFMECEFGFLHAPNFSEIIIRDYRNWKPVSTGVDGLIQTISVLTKSYPGQSILTEDIGKIHGIDDCKCGRKGSYFTISGRVPKAELRGCSDIYASTIKQD